MYSVLHHNRRASDICIYIMGENLSKDSQTQIEQMVSSFQRKVVFIDTEFLVRKMKEIDMPAYRGSYAANMRLFLDEVLEESAGRILYLDSDTVVTGELDELFQMDMHGKAIGMVLDSLGFSHKKQIGLSVADGYYNSGVILYDLLLWRERKYREKIVRHIVEQRNHYPAPDQDLLNIICRGDIFRLDVRYNFQPVHGAFSDKMFLKVMRPQVYYNADQIDEARRKVIVYHCFRFLGEFPWHAGNQHPFGKVFDRCLQHSPWRNYSKRKADTGIIIKIEKILYRVLPRAVFLPVFKYAHALFLYQSERDSLKNKTNRLM